MNIKKGVNPKRKRVINGCLISFLIIMFLIIAGSTYLYYDLNIKETRILTSDSPKHSNQIEIKVKGEDNFFTNAPIRIYYGSNGNLKKYKEIQIDNDGKAIGTENFIITWNNNERVTIVLIGEEQDNKTLEIDLSR